jgi:Flp pilus assembly protein TadD
MPAPAAAPPAAVPPAPTFAAAPANPPASAVTGTATSPGPKIPAAADQDDDDAAPAVAKAPAAPRRARPAAVAEPDADSPVRVTKAPLKVNPALLRGFDAFNRGDMEQAQLEYERAQKSDPRNTDALHGLAAIAARQGRHEQADLLYRRIAEADPQDTVAMSALINNRSQIDPGAAESRLKSLSAAQPDLAAPQFALGNLYARQGRWNEAQQAYFRAYNAEQDNPDILYNLAISLEHLRQNKLAAQYYGLAIAAAQNRRVGFDPAQATARLQALQR